jgi:hypothetical protein
VLGSIPNPDLVDEKAAADAAQAAANEAGTNTNAPPPGAGNFGGVLGSIPNSDLAKPTKKSKRSSTRQAHPRSAKDTSRQILDRREVLHREKDHCVDRLVISHFSDHSASEVCQMSSSWGPDFVSLAEGLYCDMCERELWQLCSVTTTSECFDLEKKEVRHKNEGVEQGDQIDLRKKFEIINEWK